MNTISLENRVSLIDNATNRSAVIDYLMGEFGKWIQSRGLMDETFEYMEKILEGELTNRTLYELLTINPINLDTIVWDSIFACLVNEVCEAVDGADVFFSTGQEATLNGDKWYDEYQGLFKRNYTNGGGTITDDTYEFCEQFLDKKEWKKMVGEVCNYVENIVGPVKYKWVAFSNDGAYEVSSDATYESKKECYDDMRDAVLKKMKWNTEYDEDFDYDGDAVNYEVRFAKEMIIHESFSGVYVYKIVPEKDKVTIKDIFTPEFKEWLVEHGFSRIF